MHRHIISFALVAATLSLSSCTDPGPSTLGDPTDDPQVPPRGSTDLDTWIAAGFYKDWSCEPAPHAARSPSPHGMNRICSNAAIATTAADEPFPIGAAAVKEIYNSSGTAITQFAVYRKLADGTDGDNWYWFEGNSDSVAANGTGIGGCVGCHSHAPHEFVFTAVTE
jgi:hypothetical protein